MAVFAWRRRMTRHFEEQRIALAERRNHRDVTVFVTSPLAITDPHSGQRPDVFPVKS